MILKKLLPCILIVFTTFAFAEEPATKVKLYGYVGNDFFYNSRQNVEMVDGVIQLFPKPISPVGANADVNATPQAELLSVNTRLGIDITGAPILGAKSSGRIEADFAGFGTAFYVFRIRQAFMKLNWSKTELLVGQTWHPMFGSVIPSTFSANAGAPFQPFNRSPQVRVKQTLTNTLSFTAAALYEMQYASLGPVSTSATNVYMKNAMAPNLFIGLENKNTHWTTGAGVDYKTIKPDANYISSFSGVAYAQYVNKKFQARAKAIYGENLSDQLMLGGYGVSKYNADTTQILSYTNFNNASGWVDAVYGTKFQVGLVLGASQNLGSSNDLAVNKSKKFINYGYGFYDIGATQQILDRLYRIAPHVSYNLQNMRFGLEYDFTSASYGNLQQNGTAIGNYSVNNHRVLASVMYIF